MRGRPCASKISQVLDAYPKVKGMQVMNDDGDLPVRHLRRQVDARHADHPQGGRRDALRSWTPKSNSSPVEGIEAAIRTYWTPDRQVSLYVFGDEFTGESAEEVVREVDRLNRPDASGKRRVRIHAVGFPTMFSQSQWPEITGWRFASLDARPVRAQRRGLRRPEQPRALRADQGSSGADLAVAPPGGSVDREQQR